MAEIGTDLLKAKTILDAGNLVAIPTETVYGLGGNAFNEAAVMKIFKAKNRPAFDPLIAHTDSLDKVREIVSHIPERAEILAKHFWPGSLTILLPKNNKIPDIMTSGLPQVAVRIPNHSMTLELLSKLSYPLAAPSANPFGYVSPTSAKHVNDKLGNVIPYILDGGNCSVGLESTIVGFESDQLIVYRLGGVKIEDIESVCGKVIIRNNQSSNPKAPGMIKSHYAPVKPIELVHLDTLIDKAELDFNKTGLISFYKSYDVPYQFILSKNRKLEEAAHNLFSALRYFDHLPVDKIYIENVPEEGLGRAINDRIKRAVAT